MCKYIDEAYIIETHVYTCVWTGVIVNKSEKFRLKLLNIFDLKSFNQVVRIAIALSKLQHVSIYTYI